MKIGLLTSHRWEKENKPILDAIISFFTSKGHELVTHDVSIDELEPLSYVEREAIFRKFHQKLEECDIVFAECSYQSTLVGVGLSYIRSKGRPVVIISHKEHTHMSSKGEIYSNAENLGVFEYTEQDLKEVLQNALDEMESLVDKRFTIIFPAHLMARVEEEAKRRHLPKAVYIRQLIEKDFSKKD